MSPVGASGIGSLAAVGPYTEKGTGTRDRAVRVIPRIRQHVNRAACRETLNQVSPHDYPRGGCSLDERQDIFRVVGHDDATVAVVERTWVIQVTWDED